MCAHLCHRQIHVSIKKIGLYTINSKIIIETKVLKLLPRLSIYLIRMFSCLIKYSFFRLTNLCSSGSFRTSSPDSLFKLTVVCFHTSRNKTPSNTLKQLRIIKKIWLKFTVKIVRTCDSNTLNTYWPILWRIAYLNVS